MINLRILTPYGQVLDEKVESVTLPTKAGIITILEDHTPLVSLLTPGEMIVMIDGEEKSYAISTGILEIQNENKVYLLAYSTENASDIDVDKAEKAKKAAEEEMKKRSAIDDIDFAVFQSMIEKETARIHVGRKWRSRGRR